jgi:hypothetical protein
VPRVAPPSAGERFASPPHAASSTAKETVKAVAMMLQIVRVRASAANSRGLEFMQTLYSYPPASAAARR